MACLAHILRKFFDVHAASGSPIAEEAIRRVAMLYAIEQQGAAMTSEDRLAFKVARLLAANRRRWYRNSRHALNDVLPIAYFDSLGLPRLS